MFLSAAENTFGSIPDNDNNKKKPSNLHGMVHSVN